MANRLPPLRSVEAFVVVGRLLSFSRAAEKLCISQPAVTRRIQTLEEDLGFTLFHRNSGKLALTAAGEVYLKMAAPAFDQLHDATQTLRQQRGKECVRIRLAQSLAWSWLVPLLPQFYQAYPNINLQLETATSDGDFVVEDVDMMISFGPKESWRGLKTTPMPQMAFFPVVGPIQAQNLRQDASLSETSKLPLIGLEQMPDIWDHWFHSIGQPELARRPDYVFDNLQLVIQAAASGLGLGLGCDLLCAEYIRHGRLIPLKRFCCDLPSTFHVISRPQEWDAPAIKTVRHWLLRSAIAQAQWNEETAFDDQPKKMHDRL